MFGYVNDINTFTMTILKENTNSKEYETTAEKNMKTDCEKFTLYSFVCKYFTL